MINKKHSKVVYSFLMAFCMSGIMSLVVSLFNVGFIDNIAFIWLKAWSFSFIIAFPTVFIVSPFVQKVVRLVINQ